MRDYTNKIKIWLNKISKGEPSYDKPSIKPAKDWMVIFITTQIAIVSVAVLAWYLYHEINLGRLFTVIKENSSNEEKINLNLLKKTVDDINTREENLAKTKLENTSPHDPSR